jgi:hypothetical protein
MILFRRARLGVGVDAAMRFNVSSGSTATRSLMSFSLIAMTELANSVIGTARREADVAEVVA